MATDDESPEADPQRRELERTAFSRPNSAEDAAAAAAALQQLIESDRGEAPSAPDRPVVRRAAPESAVLQAPAGADADRGATGQGEASDPLEDSPEVYPASRRRTLVPLIVAATLVVGLGIGFAAARTSPTLFAARASAPAATTTAHLRGDAVAALAALAAPRNPGDTFPLAGLETTLDIDPASMHRVLTTDDGYTLWIARASEDICLVYTSATATVTNDDPAGSNCATTLAFNETGLSLDSGNETWTWNGHAFTTTPDVSPSGVQQFPPS